MRTKNIILFFTICLFLTPILIDPCHSIDEYSLEIKITISCFPPFQSVSSIHAKIELTNMGNKTFNGTLTIEGKTEDGQYPPIDYPISNLTKEAVQVYENSYRTDDVGTYWFTVKIEGDNFSTVKLYRDSTLVDEGFQVEATSSIFLHSFAEFLTIIGIIVAAIVSIAVAVYIKKK
jgi:hypothetical protein